MFTTSEVLKGEPIKYVYHNKDGSWLFYSTKNPNLNKTKLVSLENLVRTDPTLNEIYYLNYGESAKRIASGAEWRISENQNTLG